MIIKVERVGPQFQWLSSSVSPKCSGWAEKRIQHGCEELLLLYTWYTIYKISSDPIRFLQRYSPARLCIAITVPVVHNRSESRLSLGGSRRAPDNEEPQNFQGSSLPQHAALHSSTGTSHLGAVAGSIAGTGTGRNGRAGCPNALHLSLIHI